MNNDQCSLHKNLQCICLGTACFTAFFLLKDSDIQKNAQRFYSEWDLHLFTM